MPNVFDRADVWLPVKDNLPDAELEVCVREDGEMIPLAFPCRKIGPDWFHAKSGRRLEIHPTHWRLWNSDR
jgi:hypothetical protein